MLILNGASTPTPFLSKSFLEDPAYRLGSSDRGPRSGWVRGIVLHTTQGRYPQPILPGFGRGGGALANVQYWNRAPDYAGAHLLVDTDGTVYQTSDLISEQTWHATSVNPVTVGIEIVQGTDGSLYQGQLERAVQLVNWLTSKLGIQRQIPLGYDEHTPIARLVAGGRDVVGVYGHRDQTGNRGRGDPGDTIMTMLAAAGYEMFDLNSGQDLSVWSGRQRDLGLTADGVPGQATVQALKTTRPGGLWVDVQGIGRDAQALAKGNAGTIGVAMLAGVAVAAAAWFVLRR